MATICDEIQLFSNALYRCSYMHRLDTLLFCFCGKMTVTEKCNAGNHTSGRERTVTSTRGIHLFMANMFLSVDTDGYVNGCC